MSKQPESYTNLEHVRTTRTALVLALAGIMLAAAGLRFYCLDCHGLWYDEVASVEVAQRGMTAILTDRFGWMQVQTPLHYMLVWLTVQPFDPTLSAALVRLPSAVAGLLTPLAVYGLGRETFGRAQGLLAALMIALSAVHISHSQDVRPYVFLTLLTALSVLCLLKAERTGERRWWLLFGVSAALNLLMTYHALSLAMPAIVPYLLFILYRQWRRRGGMAGAVLPALLLIGAAAALALVDLLGVPRTPPDFTGLSLSAVGDELGRVLNRLGSVGLERDSELVVQWALGVLALLGAVHGLLQRRFRAVLLCALMLLVPTVLLALLRTTNTVFQRYVLFTMPFYFLLLANAVLGMTLMLRRLAAARRNPVLVMAGRLWVGAVGGGVLMLFGLGLFFYFNPQQYKRISYLPDYRGAARMLQQAGPGDLIVLMDEPPLSMQVLDFYWHGSPPAPTFAAVDPRVSLQPAPRRIFWVLNYPQNDPAYIEELAKPAAPKQMFSSVAEFDRLLVLGQNTQGGVVKNLSEMQSRLVGVKPDLRASPQFLNTLTGSILQAQGRPQQAAALYRAAGPYYKTGDEYLATAQGFLQRGNRQAAWREAVLSLFMQPEMPQIHSLLAQMLRADGYPQQSQMEQQVADALSR